MAKIWKVIGIVMSVLVIGALGFCGIWTVRNWNTVYSSFDGTSFYTYEDMQKLKQDTIEQCAKNEVEYKKVIGELRETVLSLQNQNSVLTAQVNNLSYVNQDYEVQISILTARKKELEGELAVLQLDKVANEQLIIDLNNEIEKLNKRISELTALAESGNEQIIVLSERINQLQNSVSYYENFIADLTNDTQAVTTYEVDGAVWKIEIVNKGESFNLPVPADTSTMVFNGWTLNNVLVGNTYTVDNNVKFVADITKKYSVRFMVDDQIYNQQNIITNEFASVPTQPTKDGYEFLGWSYNGVDIVENIDTKVVTNNVVYYAVFSKLHTVRFMVDGEVYTTQTVKNGACVEDVQLDTTGLFKGWLINNEYVDLSTYEIYLDTLVVADICYDDWIEVNYYAPMKFNANYLFNDTKGNVYHLIYDSSYKLNKDTRKWDTITFNGGEVNNMWAWNVWNDGENIYYSEDTKQYILDLDTNTWNPMLWNGLTSFYRNGIWTDGIEIYYNGSYVLNKETNTWETMIWNGFDDIYGPNVWTDGTNIYYSESDKQYVLDVSMHTWSPITWNGLTSFTGSYIWSDGTNIYYSQKDKQYVLDVSTHTWSIITWNGFESFTSEYIWTDGTNIYYSESGKQYVLDDTSTNTWVPITHYKNQLNLDGGCVWNYNDNYYYSYMDDQYILNRETQTWEPMSNGTPYVSGYSIFTDGVDYFDGALSASTVKILDKGTQTWDYTPYYTDLGYFGYLTVWTDGVNYYSSFNDQHYILDGVNKTATPITWNGLTSFYGYGVWTDGANIYYSKSDKHYVLDISTRTWSAVTWNGLTTFTSEYIWSDGTNIYYSQNDNQYYLDTVTNTWIVKVWSGVSSFSGTDVYRIDNSYYIWNNGKTYVLRETVGA